jgi:hypothetical protein
VTTPPGSHRVSRRRSSSRGRFRFLFLADSELRHIFMLIHEKVSVELVSFTGCQGEKVKPVYIKLNFTVILRCRRCHHPCNVAPLAAMVEHIIKLNLGKKGCFRCPFLPTSPLSSLSSIRRFYIHPFSCFRCPFLPTSPLSSLSFIRIFYIHPFSYFGDWVEHRCHLLLITVREPHRL